MTLNGFEEFWEGFINCALWSSEKEDSKVNRPTGDDEKILRAHAMSFYSRMYFYVPHEKGNKTLSDAGHDFWLTSQGHGSGFWDGDWPIYGEAFTKLAKCYPEEMDQWLSYTETEK